MFGGVLMLDGSWQERPSVGESVRHLRRPFWLCERSSSFVGFDWTNQRNWNFEHGPRNGKMCLSCVELMSRGLKVSIGPGNLCSCRHVKNPIRGH